MAILYNIRHYTQMLNLKMLVLQVGIQVTAGAVVQCTADTGVRMNVWGNTAMAGFPDSTKKLSPISGSWPAQAGVLSVEFSGI